MAAFKSLPKQFSFPKQEREVLNFWEDISAFKQSLENRKKTQDSSNSYTFYDGPPFATGLPHYGHFVASTVKDTIHRYWTMRGKYIERRFGWDTHGLPIEMLVEKNLKLSGPTEIKDFGVDKFNEACRNNVLTYTKEWEQSITRLGRWVDFQNDYKTMDKSFMESVWWAFSELWKKNLVYQDFRVMPYSWRLATPLSNFEANLDYRNVQDPAITIKLPIKNSKNEFLLVWTTTPWTLPANLAVAVGKNITYIKAKLSDTDEVFIVAQSRASQVLGKNFEILQELTGGDLIGLTYQPAFDNYLDQADQLFRVIHSDHVSTDDGTGLVHMAPAFGQDDFEACKREQIPFLGQETVDAEGKLVQLNLNIKEADPVLIKDLKSRNLLFKHDTLQHSYPYCWRSGTPLIYKAVPTWFVKVTEIKNQLVKNNQQVHWVPESIGNKRFANWLSDAQDWGISRNRFWGTPIPIWKCEACGQFTCIGSIKELEEKSGQTVSDLHSHLIDQLTWSCETCPPDNHPKFRRIPEVFDCWFDSGSMPYAQNHYPFENKDKFEANFPADFITEGLDQTRGWFYTLLVLSTALFDKPAFKNVVVNGMVLAADGSKMSKSKKNYPDPNLVLEQYGADALRAYLINSPIVRAEPLLFNESGVKEVVRTVMLPLYHVWSFFNQYANIDQWHPKSSNFDTPKSEIDRWILSKLHGLTNEINTQMEGYYLYKIIPPMLSFIDDLTNWYIRRSRRRFWKSASDKTAQADKAAAYETLYEVLITFSKLIAPVLPFISEQIYQNLNSKDQNLSVHWEDYPIADTSQINSKLEYEVQVIRQVVSLGRALREKHKIKTRQPLKELVVVTHDLEAHQAFENHRELLKEELNIKAVQVIEDDDNLCEVTLKPNFKTLGKKLGAQMKAGAEAISKLGRKDLNQLQSGGSLLIEGCDITLEDIQINREAKSNIILESEGDLTVALETDLDQALINEGLMRETVSLLQKLRKDSGLEVTDRIELTLHTDSKELEQALSSFEATLQEELLATQISWEKIRTKSEAIRIEEYTLEVQIKTVPGIDRL